MTFAHPSDSAIEDYFGSLTAAYSDYMTASRARSATERNAYFDGIVSASNQIVVLKNAADSEDAAFATQNESTLAATQSANEATRENAEAATGDENAAYGAMKKS